jgi:histidinol-phosphate phosphatase family protein
VNSQSRAFVFLDRDGTLTVDHGFTHRVEDYALLEGVVDGLRHIAQQGYAIAIVTNQSGLGRGRFDLADLEAFQGHLLRDLARQGVTVEAVLHCPHLPDAGCACRKPEPGLLRRAERELGADLARSWVVGDRRSDVALAARGGCRGAVLVLTGCGEEESRAVPASVPRARDLVEAARILGPADQGTP